ncbi:asparagine synthase B [Lactococcus hircilactis]|uniref:asparagine synthase (glutamine-hydrolyzing) n=1 Tax=Lactococcus hircilactis TaxID=1494462 RepID=A0A7X2D0P6_9LACT|nr:asparagine synthase B [Lactococcus hircilactis]MQW38662.1 asparagine synthase B [Lactococcus hircilactis]
MCGFLFMGSADGADQEIIESLDQIQHRGPDDRQIVRDALGNDFCFQRLSIMDLSVLGRQPFELSGRRLMCNGEVYNFAQLRKFLETQGYHFTGNSDCEVLLPLFETQGIENMVKMLDAEFALILVDETTGDVYAARDPFGIRPLFYGFAKKTGKICFASEAKALIKTCDQVTPFPPGNYYAHGEFHVYHDISKVDLMIEEPLAEISGHIRRKLERAVKKRLHADAPMGYLLSGGLDSSLVCAIAARELEQPIKTFAIGMETDPIDLKYAKEVADFLKTDHTEVIMTKSDVLDNLREVIYHLETWDITTIRASIGMYMICKYIHENTSLKVLMTGEVSDEMFGYKYTDFAPNAAEFQAEAAKRVRELYMYDVLRADRCLAAHSLEARVPFADLDFAKYVMAINPQRKLNTYHKGKYLLRHAFEGTELLPDEILFREKAAFSDAVGHSMVDYLKAYAESLYTDEALAHAAKKYPTHTPFTKESLLYRDIFESFYPGYDGWIKDFWMPNKAWVGEEINDPSARVLSNYGESGK